MTVATYLLFFLGCLGATDIAVYHSIAHGIRNNPDSRHELIVHSLRGPTYAGLFLVVPNFALEGVFFWLLVGILLFDLALSIWDFAIEGSSRRFLGGLPAGEYVLHIIIAMIFGAMLASVFFESGAGGMMSMAIKYQPAEVPEILRIILAGMAVLVLFSGIEDFRAACRLAGVPKREVQGNYVNESNDTTQQSD